MITFVNIDYSINNGITWINIATHVDATLPNYSWTIPANSYSNTCLLRVSDFNNPAIYSNSAPFSISSGSTSPITITGSVPAVIIPVIRTNERNTKNVEDRSQFIEFRQVNSYNAQSLTGIDYYSVTGFHEDWTTNYYDITSLPYTVIGLSNSHDNVLKGFTKITLLDGTILSDEYLLNDESFIIKASLTASSATADVINVNVNGTFIDYKNGVILFKDAISNIESLEYSSVVRVHDNHFVCTAKSTEFNATVNKSARNITYTNTYVTGIGIYNSSYELLMVAKLNRPIKKSNKIDTYFKIQIDI